IAVITLALGIGANTAVFTLIEGAFLRPFPITEPERVVALSLKTKRGELRAFSYPYYKDFRDRNEVLSGMVAHSFAQFHLSHNGDNQHVHGYVVTGNYFDVLGVKPALGRAFTPEEDRTKLAHPVIVISYGCWQRRFGGDPGIVGQEVILNNHKFKIVGVAPKGFQGMTLLYDPEIFIPVMMQPWASPGYDWVDERDESSLLAFGRLKPGVTFEQAQASLSLLTEQLGRERPDTDANKMIEITPPGYPTPEFRKAGVSLAAVGIAAVALVLLVACANLASLLLTRATERKKEIAVRLSLGASRWRLVRQLLTESLLLSLMGGVIGVLLAMWLLDLGLANIPPMDIPTAAEIKLNGRALLFTLIMSLVTGALFGLAPALQATKTDLVSALKDSASLSGYRRSRLRGGLIVAQIAMSLLLLIVAGLVIRSLRRVETLDLGFEPERRLMMSFSLSLQGYDEAQAEQFQKRLMERVRALPGVKSASYTIFPPLSLSRYRSTEAHVEDQELTRGANTPFVMYAVAGTRYFETMGTPLVAGRDFTEHDTSDNQRVVIVNEAFVRRFFPRLKAPAEAIGKRYWHSGDGSTWYQIISVAKTGKYWTIGEAPSPFVWFTLAQRPRGGVDLVAQTEGDPSRMIGVVRDEIKRMDPNLPVTDARTMTEHLRASLAPARGAAAVLGSFGLLALTLAAIGIYGVTAYSVAQRTREIGVRMALGAEAVDVVKLIVRQGMTLTLAGLAVGLTGALVMTRLMASVLYGVSATDATTFVVVPSLLALVVLIACYLPARRATRVDPVIALRCE
ncbi:MAG TPA: ABC transporter permease, partial [Blastocatellia bacterium]|nr:ABC transporter permease [Blastocatellia bacterium]